MSQVTKCVNIVLDLDGTLIDIRQRHYEVYKKVIRDLGGKPISSLKYWQYKRNKINTNDLLEKSFIKTDLSHIFQQNFLKQIESEEFLSFDKLFPYSLPTLLYLKSQNHTLYLVSFRKKVRNASTQLKTLGVNHLFHSVKFGQLTNNGAITKAKFIDNIVSRGVPTLIIGDTEDDILAAKYLNTISIAVLTGIRSKEQLTPYNPNYVIKDIRKIPNLIKSFLSIKKPSSIIVK